MVFKHSFDDKKLQRLIPIIRNRREIMRTTKHKKITIDKAYLSVLLLIIIPEAILLSVIYPLFFQIPVKREKT